MAGLPTGSVRVSASNVLSQRLASGLGAGDLRWVEECGTSFYKIARKASSLDKAARCFVQPEKKHVEFQSDAHEKLPMSRGQVASGA